jgi:hypothetical protein
MPNASAKKQPEPEPLAEQTYTLRLRAGQHAALKQVLYRTGIPIPEQVRRSVAIWLKQQEQGR